MNSSLAFPSWWHRADRKGLVTSTTGETEKCSRLPCDARQTFRRERHGRPFYELPSTRGNGSHRCRRFEAASRHCKIVTLSNESQAVLAVVPIDADQVAKMYLIRVKQIGKRRYNMALNGPLEMPRTIALVRTLLKQKFPARTCYPKEKLPLSGFQHSLLDLTQLDLQNLFQVIPPQGAKNNHLVQAVHEFG